MCRGRPRALRKDKSSWLPGEPTGIDLGSPDLEASATLYCALFGWTTTDGRPEFRRPQGAALGTWQCGEHTGAQVVDEEGASTWKLSTREQAASCRRQLVG
ncbi:MAG: hypothetical protein NVS3B26_18570 [Mycobacteriales bacterium]